MFTQIDPNVLIILGSTVMGVLQAVKPFIPEKYVLLTLGIFSVVLGVLMASTMQIVGMSAFMLQAVINSYFIVVAASGPYSIAKSSIARVESPKG